MCEAAEGPHRGCRGPATGSRIRSAAIVMASKAESKTSLSALNLDGQYALDATSDASSI
jgi:hypothetical protein